MVLTKKSVTALAVLLLMVPPLFASDIASLDSPVSMSATLSESLVVAVTGSSMSWSGGLTQNSATNNSSTVHVQMDWTLDSQTRSNLKLYAYVSDGDAALSASGGDSIPASVINAYWGATDKGALTTVTPWGGKGAVLQDVDITSENATGTVNDDVKVNIDLSSQAIHAGDYSGTLHIRAQAI
jgi:hypothetical protein